VGVGQPAQTRPDESVGRKLSDQRLGKPSTRDTLDPRKKRGWKVVMGDRSKARIDLWGGLKKKSEGKECERGPP